MKVLWELPAVCSKYFASRYDRQCLHPYYLSDEIDYRIQLLLTALLIGIAYYVGALLSFVLRVPSTRSSIIWIPNAILLAAFIVTPVKRWWLWTLAAVPAHILAQARDAAPILVLCCPFFANIAQAGLAAFSLRHLKRKLRSGSTSFRDMGVYILVAVIAVPAVVSFTAAWLFVLAGWESDYWLAGQARWLANIVTGLTVAPLCLAIAERRPEQTFAAGLRRYVEFGTALLGLAATLAVASAWHAAETINFPVRLYAPLPFLLWAAVRFGPSGLAIALLAVAYDSISDSIFDHALNSTTSPAINVGFGGIAGRSLSSPDAVSSLMQDGSRKKMRCARVKSVWHGRKSSRWSW